MSAPLRSVKLPHLFGFHLLTVSSHNALYREGLQLAPMYFVTKPVRACMTCNIQHLPTYMVMSRAAVHVQTTNASNPNPYKERCVLLPVSDGYASWTRSFPLWAPDYGNTCIVSDYTVTARRSD